MNTTILKAALLAAALACRVASAQVIERRQAEEFVAAGEYQKALTLYREIDRKRSTMESVLDLANISVMLRSYADAEKYYHLATSYPSCPAEAYQSFGDVLMFVGKYDEARQAYLASVTRGGDPLAARGRISSCDSACAIAKRPPFFAVSNERRINTRYSEFAAVVHGDYAVFTSDRPIGYTATDQQEVAASMAAMKGADSDDAIRLLLRTAQEPTNMVKFCRINPTQPANAAHSRYDGDMYDLATSESDKARRREELAKERKRQEKLRDKKRKIYGGTGRPYLNMYLSSIQKDKPGERNGVVGCYVWTAPMPLPEPLNTGEHSGPCSFSPDGNTAYFCFSEMSDEASVSGVSHVGVMISHKIQGGWSDPALFPYNNRAAYSVGHPCISADGRTIYFSSNMPGTLGGQDIFKCELDANGEWGKPENLGSPINTEREEVFPTLDSENTLYFSSDGHPGLGGLDIFRAVGKPGAWTSVENLRAPVNTSSDDFSLVFLPGSKTEGLFSSNRLGGYGGDDIYSFRRLPPPAKITPVPSEKYMVAVTVVNRADSSPVERVRLTLLDAKSGKERSLYTDGVGKAYFPITPNSSYTLTAEAAGFLPSQAENITVRKIRPGESISLLLPLDPLVSGSTFSVENVYYDYGKAVLKKAAFKELNKVVKFMEMNADVKIELSSHTDSRGGQQGNMRLSQQRAESCVAYLVKKGISRRRIVPKGYGSTKPIVKNAKTEKQHAKNRRTEIKILEVKKDK
ncbi:MAG: OmpA family protein [Prevotellaceae bacterium]|jgi:outer membrane protein OmpA-like peptidoglycan-associated protein/tetratricopeptide (TPR) repeat protein|nr:OmpA family protein [Prevotellaceae bacterium]